MNRRAPDVREAGSTRRPEGQSAEPESYGVTTLVEAFVVLSSKPSAKTSSPRRVAVQERSAPIVTVPSEQSASLLQPKNG